MAARRLWLLALGLMTLAGCQFANSPASVAPTATVGRSASAAGTASPTRVPTAQPRATGTAPPRTATPASARSPTPAGGAPAPARTATLTRPAPTLRRAEGASPTPVRGSSPGAILPAGQEQVTGAVTNFAASARVLQVHMDGGGERQVSLAESAAIKRADGSPASPADLRPGQRVRATGRGSGDTGLIASEVILLAPR